MKLHNVDSHFKSSGVGALDNTGKSTSHLCLIIIFMRCVARLVKVTFCLGPLPLGCQFLTFFQCYVFLAVATFRYFSSVGPLRMINNAPS